MQPLFEGIAEILEVDVERVTPELRLSEHAWDSLAIVSMIALIDDLFNVMVDGQSLAKCEKISDVIALIERKKKA